ncbi:MAG: SAM-dependent chlorinase/fluorinase [Deltaproteobacteria bacterium]|nr:SAM-dependent chlorinase/fluorinase [Deltaproteobacteria bacterium]
MLITLTTDFGYRDPFVGIMKGVIAGINPNARVIDLSHDIPPQDIMAGALMLRHSAPYFPRGTIHVVVIDPGVGSARRPLLIEGNGNYFVGPDNGVLSLALEGQQPQRIIHLSNSTYHLQPASATFHGRDIFAPVAAHLSLGIHAAAFGDPVESFFRLTLPAPLRAARCIKGEIIYIDGFGNLFTNISQRDLTEAAADRLAISLRDGVIRGLAASYAAAAEGELVALVNSWGLLEIALYKGSARWRTGAEIGDKIEVILDEPGTGGHS